jgi:hypothetical protein
LVEWEVSKTNRGAQPRKRVKELKASVYGGSLDFIRLFGGNQLKIETTKKTKNSMIPNKKYSSE